MLRTAVKLQLQIWVASKTSWPTKPKYLVSGPLHKVCWMLSCSVMSTMTVVCSVFNSPQRKGWVTKEYLHRAESGQAVCWWLSGGSVRNNSKSRRSTGKRLEVRNQWSPSEDGHVMWVGEVKNKGVVGDVAEEREREGRSRLWVGHVGFYSVSNEIHWRVLRRRSNR